jgi:hypothetical protein
MLSAKMDLLMKRLDKRAGEKNEVMHIHDSSMTCEEYGETGHSGNNYPELQEDVNYINNNNYYRPQQNQDWNQQQRPNYSHIFNAGSYWSDPSTRGWNDESLLIKKGDPGRLVIPISIGSVNFNEVICDFGAIVNIMPKVIYERMFDYPLLYTTMCLQLADQSLYHAKGILEDICVRAGNSYVPVDFVVVETGGDEKSPIILGRPFLNTARAIIYANNAKICFNIKGKRESFSFKNQVLQFLAHLQHAYEPKKKKKNRRNKNKNKNKKPQQTETVRMVTTVHREHDHQLKSLHLIKKDDPGVPTIECMINRSSFQKVVRDIGSGVNIMAKVTYKYLYSTMPLYPTYAQLQMADQTF